MKQDPQNGEAQASKPEAPPEAASQPEASPWRSERGQASLSEVHRSVEVPRGGPAWRKMLAYLGPGFMVAVGYMDPGNWATDLAAGSRYNYMLLSVVLVSSLMAVFLQALAAKLGIATGRDLAQSCRDSYPKPTVWILYVLCEVAIAACDLAEVLGAAVALKLLFNLPMTLGVLMTSFDVIVVLALQGRGFRWVEGMVLALIGVIGGCFAVELWLSRPDWAGVASGMIPSPEILRDRHALYISIGVLGATVMPHNLYLHSSIVQTRNYEDSPAGKREALRFAWIDSTQALFMAFFINAAILILAASAFHRSGHPEVAEITDAYKLLAPLLGAGFASTLFAIALLASGQNSTLTGTLAGQIVMEGFINLRLPPATRRMATRALAIVPAVIVIFIRGEHGVTQLLILSQVVLSLQLSFATFPLLWLTGDRRKMGEFVNGRLTQAMGWAVCVVIAALNAWLLWATAFG